MVPILGGSGKNWILMVSTLGGSCDAERTDF